MPRITPGITSGASISSDSADLPRKSRALEQERVRRADGDRQHASPQLATHTLVTMLFMSGASAKSPVRPFAPPTNQSSVKPRHGGAG